MRNSEYMNIFYNNLINALINNKYKEILYDLSKLGYIIIEYNKNNNKIYQILVKMIIKFKKNLIIF